MSALSSAQRTVRSAKDSRALEVPTRAGFIGYGLLHLAVGWLALQIAMGHAPDEGDQSGAFRVLMRQPGGRVLLVIIVVGLAAMAVWQLLLAAVGHQTERHRTFERLASLGRTIIYGALAWTAARVVAGNPTSSARQQQQATAGLLGHSYGRVLVAIAGLFVIGLGIGMIVYGWKRSFLKRLRTGTMNPKVRRTATALGRLGYIAKGIAFGIVGVLLAEAALRKSAGPSRGLDMALRTLAAKPYGAFLLVLIALGFAAFGVYCFFQSRYRKV